MAALHSIGVRKPAALPYLIAESILDQNCTERDYTWETYRDEDPDSPTEEVVTTAHHVVWSRGGVVRKVFNFEIEKELVIQALLTWFTTEQQVTASSQVAADGLESESQRTFLTQGTQPATDPNAPHQPAPTTKEVKSRALVVFLKSQAHVFFLSGTTHVVNLPFEVDKAFPAARGLVLQRKIATPTTIPSSPQFPSAPPNSFLTNPQSFLSQTFTQNFTQPRRHGSSLGPSRLSMGLKPGPAMPLFLEELVKSSAIAKSEGLPRLYSFTDPLAELGLVVNVTTGHERDNPFIGNGAGHRRLEAIDKAEEIIYVSAKNEILFDQSGNDKPLLLVVTVNYKTNQFTIWSAAYMEPKSVSNSRKHHAPVSAHKSRRRSSYGPTAPGTGATTPVVRGTDRLRESLGGTNKSKPPPSFKAAAQNRERLSDQAVEDALASQLNPTFDPGRQPNESRRVSSLLSRAELSTNFDKTAFQDLATQRHSLGGTFNASFGASQRSRHSLGNERLSFGGFHQSRHRASTPGSMTSRMSLGGASIDDTCDENMDDTFDTIEDYDELDDLFAPVDPGTEHESMESLRKELIMSMVAEMPAQQYLKTDRSSLNDAGLESQSLSKVFSLTAPFNSATLHERKLYLYIIHSSLKHPLECELAITRKRLSPSASTTQTNMRTVPPRYACVPRCVQIQELKGARDAVKISDGHAARVACLTSINPSEPCIAISAPWGTHLPANFTLDIVRLFNPYAIMQDDHARATAGLKRTVNIQSPLLRILCPGPTGMFEVIDGQSHRYSNQIRLVPESDRVAALFRVLSLILPDYVGDFLLEIWWNVRKLLPIDQQQNPKGDWLAFVGTLFTMAVPFVDERNKKTGRKSKHLQGRGTERSQLNDDDDIESSAWRIMCSRQLCHSHANIWESNAWQWVRQAHPASDMMSPLSKRPHKHQSTSIGHQIGGKQLMLVSCADLARQFNQSPIGKAAQDHWRRLSPSEKQDLRISTLSEIVVILHLYREELKLDVLSNERTRPEAGNLAPVLAQIGHWLRWDAWGRGQGAYYDLDGGSSEEWTYEDTSFLPSVRLHSQPWDSPPSILEWLRTVSGVRTYRPFPTLATLIRKSKASPHSSVNIDEIVSAVTPRTVALQRFFRDVDHALNPRKAVELVENVGITTQMLATLPGAAQAPLMEFITKCQANPPATWSTSLLRLVQREDLDFTLTSAHDTTQDIYPNHGHTSTGYQIPLHIHAPIRDIHTICQSAERPEPLASTAESDRHNITRLIFKDDRRFMEAYTLVEPTKPSVAYYGYDSRADDAAILEGQKVLVQWVMIRTFSLPIGNSMLKFSSKKPLLTEKFSLIGFSTSCVMKPMGNVVTADRTTYSEEKFFWAFFNQGVSAGLSISRDAQGIDTSWIMYNKPTELSNRHAGLLLGLGLNGHLKNIAKWLSFKYLTPKHTMTSVGLLLGLSASYMGTMDTLVTRLLSVHVTRMLPAGAAELNLSPYTQTTGLMGIGLLYYNTQHRRMSEVMLSEIEHVDEPDPSEPPDTLRDEAYRLAAGFALGFINLGKGKDLRGLHDMRIVERLLGVAVAPKTVDIVHILDQATAGAVIALALIFMKTHDEAVARKIDVPDTLPQFDYVRPDICLLRTLAKHMIMWDNIRADDNWISRNLPLEYRGDHTLKGITKLRSEQMPFFNVLSGLLWSISLKYAGSGDTQVRDFLIYYLDQLIRINKLPAHRYDAKLARNTVRNCQDLVALSAATVMAGTGDLDIFRRLRGLHGRIGQEVPYGSHLAAHMAIGVLFIGGGTYTFNTSNKAIASLICAFYPLFPLDVQDSRAHLQAFRHFWVLAAEPRALIVRDVDTGKAFSAPITVYLRDTADANFSSPSSSMASHSSNLETKKKMTAPCLLPELSTISRIETNDPTYWPTTLDFVLNPVHLRRFRQNQTLTVRRRSPHDQHSTTFAATLVALNDAQASRTSRLMWDWLFTLPALVEFEKADIGLILPTDPFSSTFLDDGGTVVDQRLVLARLSRSWKARDLWVLRAVFEWAVGVVASGDGRVRWLGREVLERLRAGVLERGRRIGEDGGGR